MYMKKKNIFFISTFAFISIISILYFLYIRKKYLKNNKKIIKVIADLLAKPINKNNKKLINELLNIAIKTNNIKELCLITENNEFHRNKKLKKNERINLSENIQYKNKIIGFIKISFI